MVTAGAAALSAECFIGVAMFCAIYSVCVVRGAKCAIVGTSLALGFKSRAALLPATAAAWKQPGSHHPAAVQQPAKTCISL
jgi:hypothetical protein